MDESKPEPSYSFRDPTDLTKITLKMFYIYVITCIFLIISSIYEYNLLMSLKDAVSLGKETISANNSYQDMIINWSRSCFLIAIVFYFAWLYRVISNARSFYPKDITFTPGWSIVWYFLPMVFFYGPYQDMSKLCKVSQDPHHWKKIPSSSLVKWWWFFYLTSGILLPIAKYFVVADEEINSLINLYLTIIIVDISQLTWVLLLIFIMKEVYKNQLQTYQNFRASQFTPRTNKV